MKLLRHVADRAALCLLSVFLLYPFTFAWSQGPGAVPAYVYEHLQTMASKKGEVQVLVSLSTQTEPVLQNTRKAFVDSHALQSERRWANARIQDRVLERLGQPVGASKLANQPSLVIRADLAMLQKLQFDPEVALIQEDFLLKPTLAESIPRIGADTVVGSGYDASGVDIAILDSGVETTHSFMGGRVVDEACFSTTVPAQFSSSLCPDTTDQQLGPGAGTNCSGVGGCDHGTHVAGIAAGEGQNFDGTAPAAGIIAVQVFSRFDDDDFCNVSPCIAAYTSDLIAALEYLYDNRANYNLAAVNMSLGGGIFTSEQECDNSNAFTKSAIDDLRSAGIATVISSGNDFQSNAMSSPGCISTAISVGATTDSDTVASFSNSASWLSLLAPGTSIFSSVPINSFGNKSGTSMAAPHVAGAFALLRSVDPDATVDEMLSVLDSTGLTVVDLRNGIAKKRIQVDAAAEALGGPMPPPDVIVDNQDANTSQTGTWKVSSGPNPYNGQSVFNNSNSTFRWSPDLVAGQLYQVYAWWTYHSNRSNNVPYYVNHVGGLDAVEVNQKDSDLGGQWNLLGIYEFSDSSADYVEVSSENGQASADAVRFVPYNGANLPPTLSIDEPADNSVFHQGQAVTFIGTATDIEDGNISAAIQWSSSLDGAIGTGSPLVVSNLNVGDHAITALVIDNGGEQDSEVVNITINAAGGIEIIVDDADSGSTSQTGNWVASSGPNPWDGGSKYNNNGNTFRWTPDIPASNSYQVYAWWTFHSNRSDNVPYYINHLGGTSTVPVNQADSGLGGQWNLLGTYTFNSGSNHYVEVSSENGQASADAIRLVATAPPANLPPAISIIQPEDASEISNVENLNLIGSATDVEDGDLSSSIQWSSDQDGSLGIGANVVAPLLSVGPHVISASVTDNGGETTEETVSITVTDINAVEIIADNLDANVLVTGNWRKSSGANPWQGHSVYNDSNNTFRWLLDVPQTGDYTVYAWWTYHANRSSTVPYRIGHAAGEALHIVDQHDSTLGGKWIELGTYSFTAGGTAWVEVSSENGQASADAVRLVKQ